jgi:hypothetical protein
MVVTTRGWLLWFVSDDRFSGEEQGSNRGCILQG